MEKIRKERLNFFEYISLSFQILRVKFGMWFYWFLAACFLSIALVAGPYLIAGLMGLGVVRNGDVLISMDTPLGAILNLTVIFSNYFIAFFGLVLMAAATRSVRAYFASKKVSKGEGILDTLAESFRIFATNFVMQLLIIGPVLLVIFGALFFGALLSAITGGADLLALLACVVFIPVFIYILYFSFVWILSIPAGVIGNKWPMKSLNYSADLVKANGWHVFSNYFLFNLVSIVLIVLVVIALIACSLVLFGSIIGTEGLNPNATLIFMGTLGALLLPLSLLVNMVATTFLSVMYVNLDAKHAD